MRDGAEAWGGGTAPRGGGGLRGGGRRAGVNPLGAPRGAQGEARVPGPADGQVHHDGPRRRLARRPVATSTRASRGEDQAGCASIYGHGWLALAVAGGGWAAPRPRAGRVLAPRPPPPAHGDAHRTSAVHRAP